MVLTRVICDDGMPILSHLHHPTRAALGVLHTCTRLELAALRAVGKHAVGQNQSTSDGGSHAGANPPGVFLQD